MNILLFASSDWFPAVVAVLVVVLGFTGQMIVAKFNAARERERQALEFDHRREQWRLDGLLEFTTATMRTAAVLQAAIYSPDAVPEEAALLIRWEEIRPRLQELDKLSIAIALVEKEGGIERALRDYTHEWRNILPEETGIDLDYPYRWAELAPLRSAHDSLEKVVRRAFLS